jgi:hypothetical protein
VTQDLQRTTCAILYEACTLTFRVETVNARNAASEAAPGATLRMLTFPLQCGFIALPKLFLTQAAAKAGAHVATGRPGAAQGWRR